MYGRLCLLLGVNYFMCLLALFTSLLPVSKVHAEVAPTQTATSIADPATTDVDKTKEVPIGKPPAVDSPKIKDILTDSSDNQIKTIKIPDAAPDDKYSRGTPLSSMLSLISAINQGNYEHAADFMDLRNLPLEVAEQGGAELARKLRIVANRTFWVEVDNLSNDPVGKNNDGLPAYRDRITRIETPDGPIDILMQRVPGEKGMLIWKISNSTVAKIPRLYELYGYGKIGDDLSRLFPYAEFLGLQAWQWLILLVIIIVAYGISWLLTSIINLFLRRHPSPRSERWQYFIARPFRFIIVVLIVRANFEIVGPSLKARAIFEAKTMYILAIAWLLMGLAELVLGRIADRLNRSGAQDATLLLRPAGTALKVTILAVAIIVWLDNMGFKVTTLLAGLGVGSVAIALAAQKSVENLIGAITMYTAQPVRMGDFCRFGKVIGVVEEIGLRATMVRTLDRTIVSIPNSDFANNKIENFTQRDKLLYKRTIRISIDTSADQLRYILVAIREMLYSHVKVDSDPARVRFLEIGEHSLDLQIFAYIKTTDFNEFLGIAEDINLYIMDIVGESGAKLALPAQSVQIEQGIDVDEKRIQETKARVKAWREQDALMLPEFPEQRVAELKDTLEYPAKGSYKPSKQ